MLEYLGYENETEFVSDIGGMITNCMHPDDRNRVDQLVACQLERSEEYAVSYTHLDVYKRQPMLMPPWTWALAVSGLIRIPESWTLMMSFTVTRPRGMSTSISTKQQPEENVLSLHWLVTSAVILSLIHI